ncbi:hypothetical protein X922_05430 [Pseudomonas aeruginosa VRFPA08]|nr:hypothetical protein U769_01290 [Pseudomonas aeruginosa MTB-1]ETD53729.1 hypothetical protein X922_05430 [Pseudomonas aeruginosa VRFPA08]
MLLPAERALLLSLFPELRPLMRKQTLLSQQ